jgi:predicted aspartyl protease
MRARIALQSTWSVTSTKNGCCFAEAFGVRGHVGALKTGDPALAASHCKAMSSQSRHLVVVALIVLALAPVSIFGAGKRGVATQLPGYKAVRVHYGPMNKMIMSVRINARPANLLVDTGASQIILNDDVAELAGVRPFQRAMNQVRFSAPTQIFTMRSEINGQSLPVGIAHDIAAGNMSFGSNPVALRESAHSGSGAHEVDGVLGLDILLRYKALINCRTKLVFFKVDQGERISLASAAASEKYTRIPIQRAETGALTVPCTIRGQPTRLLIDTGAFVTILHEAFVKPLGVPVEPTRISAQFARGASQRINAAKINDLTIGTFKMPPEKIGVAPLPRFALHQGDTNIAGILGMDTLYICQAIIDLDGMNLFLK